MVYISNEERRKQFVEAATRVIREHGLGAATTRRIAEAADAPLGSLHYCFRGKDEVYEAVMRNLGWEGMNRLRDSVTPGMGVSAAAAAILHASTSWLQATYEDCLTEWEVFIWAMRSEKFAHFPAGVYRDWVPFLSGLLADARTKGEPTYDFDAISRMMLTFIDGYSLQDQFLAEHSLAGQFDFGIKVITRAIDAGDFAPRRRARRKSAAASSA